MSEKTIAVRLKLIYDAFVKGSKESGQAIKGIGDEAQKTTKKTNDSWGDLGKRTAQMGSKLTSSLTVPIVGAGVAMGAMATQFDNAFVAMTATAGVAQSEVSGLKDATLALSASTGRGPQELAEALMAVRSAGFSGAEAMDVLEMAARGASAGMGTTKDLANALTNVIAAYGSETITAAQAMDVLTAAVQEGKSEAAEMAPQFGRLLPIAAELDVSFADVAGSLAYLTRASGDAAQSSTQLQGILSKLLKPSMQGEEALKGIGESARSLRSMLAEKGLLGTLVDLRARLGDVGFNLLFDDIQATQGALQLTGSEMSKAKAVIDAVADSAGAADAAFGKWAESMGAKQSMAWAKVQVGLIQLGDQIAPTASQLIGLFGDLVAVFADLPDPVQKAVVVFAALAAAAGPAMTVGGNLIKAYSGMSGVFQKVGTATTGMSSGIAATATGFAILAPIVVIAGVALQSWVDKQREAKRITGELTDALEREAAGMEGLSDAFLSAELAGGKLGSGLRDANADVETLIEGIKGSGPALEDLITQIDSVSGSSTNLASPSARASAEIDRMAESGSALGIELKRLKDEMGVDKAVELARQMDALSDGYDNATDAAENNEFASESLADQQGVTAEQTERLTEALNAQLEALRAQYDPFFALQDAMAGVRDAQAGWEESIAGVAEAQAELDKAISEHGENSAEAAEAARGLAEAENGVTDAQWASSEATVNLVAAGEELRRKLEEQGLSADTVRQQLYDWAIGVGFSKDEALKMADGVYDLTGALKNVPPLTAPAVQIRGVEDSIRDIEQIQYRINQLHGRDVGIRIVGDSVGVVMRGGARAKALGGPVRKNEGYLVGERGPEWFEPEANGRIVPNHLLGTVVPQSSLSGGGGSVMMVNHFHLEGAIVSSKADAERWVSDAWNRAAGRNMVTVRGRPL